MAATVLGKRQRPEIDTATSSLPLPSRKRRNRNSTPAIHDDNEDSTISQAYPDDPRRTELDGAQCKTQPATRSLSTRNVLPNGTFHNKTVQSSQNDPYTVSKPSCAVNDENEVPIEVFKTPTATRFHDGFSNATPIPPRYRVQLISKPLTPRTPRTPRTLSSPIVKTQTVYTTARQLFTQASSPSRLIGRDAERRELSKFILEAVNSKSGGCIYVSGPPGTGKSALIEEVSHDFPSDSSLRVVNVNCVSIKSSKDVYAKLVQDLTPYGGSIRLSDQATLEDLFIPRKRSTTGSYLVVLDEIDSLLDTDCEVLYSLFEWSLHRSSRLLLIGIANALDLTDRFLPRLKARNLRPRLLSFLPYTAPQIASIITERLRSTMPARQTKPLDFVPFMHPAAVELCSKKVASQSGDLRKAFNLVRRAIDQIEREIVQKQTPFVNLTPTKQPLAEVSNLATPLPPTPQHSPPTKPNQTSTLQGPLAELTAETAPRASVAHVARLASSIFNNGTTSRLAALNLQQKAVLCSLLVLERKKNQRDPYKTPTKSSNKVPSVRDLFMSYKTLCKVDDGALYPLSNTEFRDVVTSLETLGLVVETSGRGTNLLTPTKTPSKLGRSNPDERQISSAVSVKEMSESLNGPGADLLLRLMPE